MTDLKVHSPPGRVVVEYVAAVIPVHECRGDSGAVHFTLQPKPGPALHVHLPGAQDRHREAACVEKIRERGLPQLLVTKYINIYIYIIIHIPE